MTGLNVVILNDYPYVEGGASRVAVESARRLSQIGMDVIFLAGVEKGELEVDELEGVRLVSLGQRDILKSPVYDAAARGIWNAAAALKMNEILDGLDRRDTIVHVHSWTKALSSSPAHAALKRGFKVVFTMHDYFLACPNGGFYNYKRRCICNMEPLSTGCVFENCDSRMYLHKIWRVLRQVVQNKALRLGRNAVNFIAVSDLSAEIMRCHIGENSRIFKVRNPVCVQKGIPAQAGSNRGFVFVGRLSPEKGCSTLARAGAGCKEYIEFIGDGRCRGDIELENPSAAVTGWMKGRDVVRELTRFRALVFPSLWYETLGLVVLEAMASGLPVVVSRGCAAEELVEDGINGLLFEMGDEEDLGLKLKRLAEDDEFAATLGENAYNMYWEDPFTLDKHVSELVKVYDKILNGA